MSRKPVSIHLKWMRLAEECLENGDYAAAANHLRRLAHYFRLNGDMIKFREYMRKTGDCYLRAAKRLWSSDKPIEASLLYVKAAECYREIEDYDSAENCNHTIREYYGMIARDGFSNFQGSSLELKTIGDHFRGEEKEKAVECYEAAARKAEEEGRLILAGGLYGDAGDCSLLLKDTERAAENYANAAGSYFKSEKYFEAAWHYNISGFLFISLDRFEEAIEMAERARNACYAGEILILLNNLSRICELLGRRDYHAAEEEWRKIKGKFKKDYADLVSSCIEKVKENLSCGK